MATKIPSKLVQKRSLSQRLLMFALGINRDLAIQSFFSFLIVVVFAAIFHFGFFNRAENLFLDLFFRWSPVKAVDHVISVEIREDALISIKERPIPDKYFAKMIQILKEWGARAVVFDFVLEGQTGEGKYIELQKAISDNKSVYLPLLVGKSGGREVLIRSPLELESRAQGVGHIHVNPDNDGIVRHFQPFIEAGGRLLPHLGLKLVYDTLGRKIESPADLWTRPNSDGSLIIPWAGKWAKAFKHYSFMDVLNSYERLSKKERPFVQPKDFKDKICLVGYSGVGGHGNYATPIEKSVPAMGVIAGVINGALLNDFVQPEQDSVKLLYLIFIGFLSIIFFTPFRNFFSTLTLLGP